MLCGAGELSGGSWVVGVRGADDDDVVAGVNGAEMVEGVNGVVGVEGAASGLFERFETLHDGRSVVDVLRRFGLAHSFFSQTETNWTFVPL